MESLNIVKKTPFSNEEISALASKVPTPFHLYDEATIRKNCRELNEAFSWAPSFKNHFAIKATPNPNIVKIVKEEGCGGDCSSMAELMIAEAVGITGENIMFTSNNTPLEEYKKAMQLGAIINFDDISHVDFVKEKLGMPDLACFRYNPGSSSKGNAIIGNPAESKFGVTREQLFECYAKAREYGSTRFALHTMIVSNCLNEDDFVETARMVFGLAIELKSKHGIRLEMIDLGGGLGIPYKPEQQRINLKSLGQRIQQLYTDMIIPAELHPLKLAYECGRYITANAGVLVTRVIHQKDIYKKYLGVDACIADLMRPPLYGAYHHIDVIRDPSPNLNRLPSSRCIFKDAEPGKLLSVDVVGSLCENNDKLATDRMLPSDICIGDLLVIHDTGAHGHAMGYNYNGKLRSGEYIKLENNQQTFITKCFRLFCSNNEIDENIVQCRKAESHADLFSTITWSGSLPGKRFFDSPVVRGRTGFVAGLLIAIIALKWMKN